MSEAHTETDRNAADIAELLIQLGRLAYSASVEPALTPTQWMALRYFARANRFSRTVSGFAEYHATTRGTVSQTIKTLTEKGYLSRSPSESDGRSVRLDLTAKGRDAVAADPLSRLIDLIGEMPDVSRHSLGQQLRSLTEILADTLQRPRFGLCRHCRFLQAVDNGSSPEAVGRCRLLDADLEPPDLAHICLNFSAA